MKNARAAPAPRSGTHAVIVGACFHDQLAARRGVLLNREAQRMIAIAHGVVLAHYQLVSLVFLASVRGGDPDIRSQNLLPLKVHSELRGEQEGLAVE